MSIDNAPKKLTHSGDYGPFMGHATDTVVFGHYRRHDTWSPELVDLLCALLDPGIGPGRGTFIDVGANIGLVSIPVTARSGAQCFAIEAVPDNAALLRENVALHGLTSRIQVHACAARERGGVVTMALSEDNHGDHRVVRDGSETLRSVQVPAASLDDLLADLPLPGPVVMKMDTQGSEVDVLRGATRLLPRVDYLIIEYWPLGLAEQGHSLRELNHLLASFPQAVLLLGQPKTAPMAHLEPSAPLLERLEHLLADDDPGFFDLLLTRRSP